MTFPFIKLHHNKAPIRVNMNLVSHITENIPSGSVLYFVVVLNDEPLYIVVEESLDEIGSKPGFGS